MYILAVLMDIQNPVTRSPNRPIDGEARRKKKGEKCPGILSNQTKRKQNAKRTYS
jgi:hypothetical protein